MCSRSNVIYTTCGQADPAADSARAVSRHWFQEHPLVDLGFDSLSRCISSPAGFVLPPCPASCSTLTIIGPKHLRRIAVVGG